MAENNKPLVAVMNIVHGTADGKRIEIEAGSALPKEITQEEASALVAEGLAE